MPAATPGPTRRPGRRRRQRGRPLLPYPPPVTVSCGLHSHQRPTEEVLRWAKAKRDDLTCAFSSMSNRRHGSPEREAGEAGRPSRPRRQGAHSRSSDATISAHARWGRRFQDLLHTGQQVRRLDEALLPTGLDSRRQVTIRAGMLRRRDQEGRSCDRRSTPLSAKAPARSALWDAHGAATGWSTRCQRFAPSVSPCLYVDGE